MGVLLFLIIVVAMFGGGIAAICDNRVGVGLFMLITSSLIIGFIVFAFIYTVRQHKKKLVIVDNFLKKCDEINEKIDKKALKIDDFLDYINEKYKYNKAKEINNYEENGLNIIEIIDKNNREFICFTPTENELDFDKTAELQNKIIEITKKNKPTYYIKNNNTVYENLIQKIAKSLGVSTYKKDNLINDIKQQKERLIADRETIEREYNEPPVKRKRGLFRSYGKYQKIFPNMMCDDNASDDEKMLDDFLWMDDE